MEFNRKEQEVERLIIKGLSVSEISQRLRITERTFKFYLTSILLKYKKLKNETRFETA